jgi:toxin ParE1/3/4
MTLPQAELDVEGHARYIAQYSRAAADRFIDAVDETLQIALAFPELGSPWEAASTRFQDLRWWRVRGFPNHLIFYRSIPRGIEVIRVVHGAQDLEALFREQ